MTENNLFGVILAGGSGSRLWPLSREMYPKQLLKLIGENSLFESTVLRLLNLMPQDNIVTVTNEKHSTDIKIQLEGLKANNSKVVGEPVGRNTAAAVGLCALYIKENLVDKNIDPIILVTPSDHLIKDEETFLNAVKEGIKLAQQGYVITFGIKPTKPETGYGYIKTFVGQKLSDNSMKVAEFKEKPDLQTAKLYLESENYFWNSGIFMFAASTILKEMEIHCNDVLEGLLKLDLIQNFIDKELYLKIPSISVDYAVMEKSNKICLIPVDCGWNDLGSWEAIFEVEQKDMHNNVLKGDIITKNSQNCFIYSSSRFVSAVGINDKVIIETPDAVLVCDKKQSQDVKLIFDELKKNNSSLYEKHKVINELWGSCESLSLSNESITNKIIVKTDAKLLLYNNKRHIYITSGAAKVIYNNNEIFLKSGESFDFMPEKEYALENIGNSELEFIEIINN